MPDNPTFFVGRELPTCSAGPAEPPPPKAIPIIFIPGIMGSNLRVRPDSKDEVRRRFEEDHRGKEYTDKAWALPSVPSAADKVDILVTETTYLMDSSVVKYSKQWERYGPKFRQIMLNPETTEVDDNGFMPDDIGKIDGKDGNKVARLRGWGSLHWDSYGPFLRYLEMQLNPMPYACSKEHRVRAQKAFLQAFPPFNAAYQFFNEKELAAISNDKAIEHASQFCYPVFAFGYNWTRSCLESAQLLLVQIDKWIDRLRQIDHLDCGKVILVTHSMGGLVGRVAAMLEKENKGNKILGIVHGVMPATGAPEAYRQIVAGEVLARKPLVRDDKPLLYGDLRMVKGRLLGRNRAEATAVIANAPGALELLPSHLYGPGWLQIEQTGPAGEVKTVKALPASSNPYGEIYKEKEAPWRMVVPELLDPAGLHLKKINQQPVIQNSANKPWIKYVDRINDVEEFHRKYLNKNDYHKPTYAFIGTGINSHRNIRWQKQEDGTKGSEIDSANSNGEYALKASGSIFRMLPADGKGDGTVPEESGNAPKGCKFVRRVCQIPSLEHQEAFKAHPSRAYTVLAICQMVRRWKG